MRDEQMEVDQLCANISELRWEIIEDFQRILHKYNQLLHVFRTTLDRMAFDKYKVVIRGDKRPVGEHKRRFNALQVNEIIVVIRDSEYTSRDIIIQRREGLQHIPETHHSYDALQFPLIFMRRRRISFQFETSEPKYRRRNKYKNNLEGVLCGSYNDQRQTILLPIPATYFNSF